jgi:tetratricopeptide (TPR) repeat protein
MVFVIIAFLFLGLEGKEVTVWEQKESQKIFEKAGRLEEQGQLEDAVKEYSEILEFFPDTTPWREACIRLSDLYLKTRREDQSQLVLARLRREDKSKTSDLEDKVLIAHVQNFVNREAYGEMKTWLLERSPKERQILRGSESLIPLWAQLQVRSGLEPKVILELWSLLGHQHPVKALVSLGREKDLPFTKDLLSFLHLKVIEMGEIETLRSITGRMVRDGWGKIVHGHFKACGKKADPWKSLWLHAMISGRLHEEALEVLDTMEDSQDRIVERIGVLVGLERYEDGFHLLRANASWLENALTLYQFEALLEGIMSLPQAQLYREQFFEVLKEGGRKELLLSKSVLKGEEREKKLRELSLKDDFYGPSAALNLGEILAEEGRLEELKAWVEIVAERFPGSEVLAELKKKLGILSSLKGEVTESVSSP